MTRQQGSAFSAPRTDQCRDGSGEQTVPSIGIIMLETQFPRPLGDIGCSETWPFPVHFAVVSGASPLRVVHQQAEGLLEPFLQAARDLAALGVGGITTSCGFLSLFQAELAAAVEVPVATSALMQVPLINAILPPGKRAGVLTISARSLGPDHLAAAGAPVDTPIGSPEGGNFTRSILGDQAELDQGAAQAEMVAAARDLCARHGDVGALVLECTNMPPYAAAVQAALGIPVYSIVDFIRWFHAGLRPRRYAG